MAFHGKHEYVSIQDMQKSVDTIIELAKIWEREMLTHPVSAIRRDTSNGGDWQSL